MPSAPVRFDDGVREIVRSIGHALAGDPKPPLETEGNLTSSGYRRRPDALAALFPAYAEMAGTLSDDSDSCSTLIDTDLDRVQRSTGPCLYGGWAGLGWVTTHLNAEDDVVGAYVDRLLTGVLERREASPTYDLISGFVGLGVYFLERLPRKSATRGLGLILDALERAAVETDAGTTWFTVPEVLPEWQRQQAPSGYYNLGVAHGVPGVCWLLARLCTRGIEPRRAELLLRNSLRWLRANQPDPTQADLPSWIAPGADRLPNRRIAWCYGPLGASAVALEAAKVIGDAEGLEWARAMALACARVPPEEAGIRDAGLCHGAAGNAQIFYRLARNNSEPRFAKASSAWFRATLKYAQPGVGVGGYRMWGDVGQNRPGWVDDGSFLSGSAGVGLALLAATTDIEPQWDRLLLLS